MNRFRFDVQIFLPAWFALHDAPSSILDVDFSSLREEKEVKHGSLMPHGVRTSYTCSNSE